MNILRKLLKFGKLDPGLPQRLPDQSLQISSYLYWVHGVPQLDGNLVFQRLLTLAPEIRQCEGVAMQKQWLNSLRDLLGMHLEIVEGERCLLVSALSDKTVQSICHYFSKVERMLDAEFAKIDQTESYGKSVLLILPDSEEYYKYLASLEELEGEFPASSATFISGNCSHFVTHEGEIGAIEPIIAHELVHDKFSHLTLPTWLHEGVATYVEMRLTPARPSYFSEASPLLKYWLSFDIETFWDGCSFDDDEGAKASEILALLLVKHLMGLGDKFVEFLAIVDETGDFELAANECWRVSIRGMVDALLEQIDP